MPALLIEGLTPPPRWRRRAASARPPTRWRPRPLIPCPLRPRRLCGPPSGRACSRGPREAGMCPLPRAVLRPPAPRRAGMVIGDSFVRRATFHPQVADWEVTTWVPTASIGKTWDGCLRSGALIQAAKGWAETTRQRGMEPAAVTIWLGGNDIYPLGAPPGPLSSALWTSVRKTTIAISEEVAPVIMVGPTPRPSRDAPLLRVGEDDSTMETKWEATAAFRCLDRPVNRWLSDLKSDRLRHLSVGKCVLERQRETRKVSAYMLSRAALVNFDRDGIHLSPAGYRKVVAKAGWPGWLQPSA